MTIPNPLVTWCFQTMRPHVSISLLRIADVTRHTLSRTQTVCSLGNMILCNSWCIQCVLMRFRVGRSKTVSYRTCFLNLQYTVLVLHPLVNKKYRFNHIVGQGVLMLLQFYSLSGIYVDLHEIHLPRLVFHQYEFQPVDGWDNLAK